MERPGTRTVPAWIAGLRPDHVEWRTFRTPGGSALAAWAATIVFPAFTGQRYDALAWDCRKGAGLVAAEDGAISCAEVEVTTRLRAAGFLDAGWLATCGRRLWTPYQRPRRDLRGAAAAAFPRTAHLLPVDGNGAPDVVALVGPHPVFVECKGTEPLQDNQAAWLATLLTPEELSESFAVVLRVIAGEPGSWVATETAETTTPAADELARLFAQAWEASGFDRISFRDRIAERGAEAITYALRELESHPSSGFPVQVIEAVGHRGHASPAAAALVEIARRYPGQHGLADAARARLPVNSGVPSTRSSAPAIPYGDLPVHGAEPPQHVGYCDFLTARAVPCENYGRYRRGEYWACSSHAKAQNPRPIPPRAR